MRVRLLRPFRYEGIPRDVGDEIEVSKEEAFRWTRDGQAVPVPKSIKEKAVRTPKETR